MICDAVLKAGLAALGEAYSRKVDRATERIWKHALRELSDDQFRFGVDVVIRSDNRFFPPPGVVLAAAFDAPRDAVPATRAYLREGEDFWGDIEACERVYQAVKENPISTAEAESGQVGALHYIRRVASASGLLSAGPGKGVTTR